MFSLQGSLFLILLCGFTCGRCGLIQPALQKGMSGLVLQVLLPCNILASFISSANTVHLLECLEILGLACIIQVVLGIVSKRLFLRVEPPKRKCLQYGLICSNATFLGLPLIQSVYGATGVVYASVAVLPLRLAMWTEGIALFSCGDGKSSVLKVMKSPCVLSVVAGVLYLLFPFALPMAITKAVSALGQCTTGMVMLVIGAMLCDITPKQIFNGDSVKYCTLRLLVIPLTILFGGRLIGLEKQTLGILTMMQGMPMATTGVMLAEEYGADSLFSTELLFVSTLCSMVTLPVLLWAV